MLKYVALIFLGCSVVFGALAYYYHARAESYCEMWKKSKANNDFLVNQRRKDYEDTLAISKRNKELEEEAIKDKSYFNWMADISRSGVIVKLKQK